MRTPSSRELIENEKERKSERVPIYIIFVCAGGGGNSTLRLPHIPWSAAFNRSSTPSSTAVTARARWPRRSTRHRLHYCSLHASPIPHHRYGIDHPACKYDIAHSLAHRSLAGRVSLVPSHSHVECARARAFAWRGVVNTNNQPPRRQRVPF